MASRSPSPRLARSPSRDRHRYRSRTRSPVYHRRPASRSPTRSRSPPPRRNVRYRSRSRSWSREHPRDGRPREQSPRPAGTKIVVERLSKNIREPHLDEIFSQYGRILDLDVPMSRAYNTNRGTAYILFEHREDAEIALANMHEGEIDGCVVNVSIVLPRGILNTDPPLAARGANIDPRERRGNFNHPPGGGYSNDRRGPMGPPTVYHHGPRPNNYGDPSSRVPPAGAGQRSRSRDSYSSLHTKSPRRGYGGGGGGGGYDRHDDYRRQSPPPYGYDNRDRSPGPRRDFR